jgi:hypothetical protein
MTFALCFNLSVRYKPLVNFSAVLKTSLERLSFLLVKQVPSRRAPSPSPFTLALEQHERSASLAQLPSANRHHSRSRGSQEDGEVPSDVRNLHNRLMASSGVISNPDLDGDRTVPLSRIRTGRKSPKGGREPEVMSDGLPPKRVFDRLNVREKGKSPRAASVSAAVVAAQEGLGEPSPREDGEGGVDVNLDRMVRFGSLLILSSIVFGSGDFVWCWAVERGGRQAWLRGKADGGSVTF